MSGIMNMFVATKTTIATAVDAFFNSVSLLLNTSSTNGAQNNTFLDSSTNNFTITRNGNTTQGTFTPFSQTGWGNYFNGTTDYLSPGTTATNFICTDTTSGLAATFEAWVFPTSWNGVSGYMNNTIWAKGGTYATFGLYNGTLQFFVNGGGTVSSSSSVPLNTWSYVAVTLSGSTVTFYINGVSAGSGTLTGGISGSGTSDYIAYQAGGPSNSWFAGYISNFRISNVVRTISASPTTAFTSDANTVVLSCQSNRFVDNSTNAFAITPTGTPSVQAFSPFLPTAAYDTAVVGGSGYFDGSGDWLNCGSQSAYAFGTGNFTFEAWVYVSDRAANYNIAATRGSAGTVNGWNINITTSGGIVVFTDNFVFNGVGTVPLNAWTHIVFTREGTGTNQTKIYINGISVATATNSQDFSNTTLGIGNSNDGSQYPFLGYISGARLVKGTAVYTSAFTPPTAPPTAITNTSLLLSCTNAGIYDSASKNVLETVGNAQVSTTQAKWGTTSMYFDGTGDYLISYNAIPISSGDFTIECWVYMLGLGSDRQFVQLDIGTTITNVALSINGSGNTVRFLIRDNSGTNNLDLNSSVALSANTWYHIAGTVSGTSGKLFINGSSTDGATGTVSGTRQASGTVCRVGVNSDNVSRYMYGYIDDVRLTKGYARYTANFTPPTAAFPLQ